MNDPFDPQTHLALRERIEELEAERDRWKDRWQATVEDADTQRATIARVRDLHQNEDGHCVRCSEDYGLTVGTYPCPPIQALEGDQK